MAQALYSDKSNSITEISRTLRVSRSTLYRHIEVERRAAAEDRTD